MATKLGIKGTVTLLGPAASPGTRATWGAVGTGVSAFIHSGAAPAGLSVPVTFVKDLSISLEKDKADASSRASTWELSLSTLKKGSVEFDLVYDETDPGFQMLQNSFLSDITVAAAVLDGLPATSGVQGLWADFSVSKFTKSEKMKEVQTVSVSLDPAPSAVAPEWVTVT